MTTCWFTSVIVFSQMNGAWEGLNRTWRERMERLEEAMTASVQYQDALQVCASGLLIVIILIFSHNFYQMDFIVKLQIKESYQAFSV